MMGGDKTEDLLVRAITNALRIDEKEVINHEREPLQELPLCETYVS